MSSTTVPNPANGSFPCRSCRLSAGCDEDLVSASGDGEAPVVTGDAFDRERLVLVGHHRDRGRRCVTCFWFGFVSVCESKARQDCQKINSRARGLKTSLELLMLSRSLSDCKSLLLNFVIQVSQFFSNSQACH